MRINHNVSALNTYSRLSMANSMQSKSLEKLSSGMRINRAGDDAAGLAISEKMRGQIRGLNQASRNAQDGISMIQTAEGALTETHSILQRMRELAVQAANDTLTTTDRDNIEVELDELANEVDRIAQNTTFNTKDLLKGTLGVSLDATSTLSTSDVGLANLSDIEVTGADADTTYSVTDADSGQITIKNMITSASESLIASDGAQTLEFESLGISITTDSNFAATATNFNTKTIVTTSAAGATFQLGANAGEETSIAIDDMQAAALSVTDGSIAVDTQANAESAITSINSAIDAVSTQRAKLGAYQNRLEHTINNLTVSAENLTSSESRIRDVDMAKEMMEFTKNNILTQAATAMLAQANQQPQSVLQLLR